MKMIQFLIPLLLLTSTSSRIVLAAGKIQDSDFTLPATIIGAGGSLNQLEHDDKIFIQGLGVQMSTAITSGAIANFSVPALMQNFSFNPSAPVAGSSKLYFKTDGLLYSEASNGSVTQISSSSGSPITSVGFAAPASIFSVSGSPITMGAGTISETLITQTANSFFAGPTSGVGAVPTFRAMVDADLPSLIEQNSRYVNFLNGSDIACPAVPCGDGSFLYPWKTLAHAYAQIVTATQANPITVNLSGGNNDSDGAPIIGKPNINLVADAPITISQNLTILGGATNDEITLRNLNFQGAFNWTRNDATFTAITLTNVEFFTSSVMVQNGAGTMLINAFNVYFLNAEFLGANTGSTLSGCAFSGTTLFDDSTIATFYLIEGGYNASQMTVNGGIYIELGGVIADVPFGNTLTSVTTANGTPTIMTDAGSIPPTITGAANLLQGAWAQYVGYIPAVPGNWGPVPTQVASALDELASRSITGSGTVTTVSASILPPFTVVVNNPTTTPNIVISAVAQAANTFYAGPPSGPNSVAAFRFITPVDLPALPYMSSTLINSHIFVGSVTNTATDVPMSGDVSITSSGVTNVITAVPTNTPFGIVRRDANGDFAANVITASLNGNATNVTGTVQADHGGTGQNSLTTNAVLIGNGVGPVNFVSPGANGDCLQVVAGVWTSVPCSSGGGSSAAESFVNISSSTQLAVTTTVTNYLVDMTSGIYPITLPAVAGKNATICFKKIDATGNPVSVTAQAGEAIDGDPSLFIETQNAVNCIKTDGVTNYVF